ncbi:hypothetical protein [Sphingomonas sp. Ant H11]|uniref:hypothetical protein n=1 Tax=Sphingomonas sp. Ant H11 TaxID=1564113 RepID=UPI002F402893
MAGRSRMVHLRRVIAHAGDRVARFVEGLAERLGFLQFGRRDLAAVGGADQPVDLLRRPIGFSVELSGDLVEAVNDAPGEPVGDALQSCVAQDVEQRRDQQFGRALGFQRVGHPGIGAVLGAVDPELTYGLGEGSGEAVRRLGRFLGIERGDVGEARNGTV